jgi:hypothetical protein
VELPENLKEIVDRLGNAMVAALAKDEDTHALAKEIQAMGFDLALVVEATVALQRREGEGEPGAGETVGFALTPEAPQEEPQWSEEDKAFLRTFRISM